MKSSVKQKARRRIIKFCTVLHVFCVSSFFCLPRPCLVQSKQKSSAGLKSVWKKRSPPDTQREENYKNTHDIIEFAYINEFYAGRV